MFYISVNSKVKKHIAEKIARAAQKGECIGILGLSFKPESDDVGETAALDIIKMLTEKGYDKIIAYDPLASESFKKAYGLPLAYAATFEEVADKCSVIAILTAWQEFKEKQGLLSGKTVIDGRYFLQ